MDQSSPNIVPPEQIVPTQSSPNTTPYIVGVVVVIAALALWYFYSTQTSPINTEAPTATTQTSPTDQAQTPAATTGNTTADISTDLNQAPDSSAALDADAAASASDLNSL